MTTRHHKGFETRAKLPKYFRAAALAVLAITVLAIIIGIFRGRDNPDFRMRGFPTSLSKDIIAEVAGYERRETEGDKVLYYIKAEKATTFADRHQEMENVYLQVFDGESEKFDQITAEKAVYLPGENKNFTGYFAGNVNIETRDQLKIKTEQVTYRKEDETAVAEELVEFERDNIRGKAIGASVNIRDKKLDLLKDVEIEAFESPELAKSNVRYAKLASGSATVDQAESKIILENGVTINIEPRLVDQAKKIDARAEKAVAFLGNTSTDEADPRENPQSPQLKKIELIDNVRIESIEGERPMTITAGHGIYEKDADKFELKNAVHIQTSDGVKTSDIRAGLAIYEQQAGKIFLSGGAEISQVANYLKGDNITAELHANRNLKFTRVRGNAYLRQTTAERTSEVSAEEFRAAFDSGQNIQVANATGQSRAVLTPSNSEDYSKVTMSAPRSMDVWFKGEGLVDRMQTGGRTTLQFDVLNNAPDAAHKRVTADTLRAFFADSGKDLYKAEAIGNAELFIDPLTASEANYKTTIQAPRFDCDFYETGNNPRICIGGSKTKTVRVPTIPGQTRGTQTIIANKLNAAFGSGSRDIERLDALGSAKFTEIDRNATADKMSYTSADRTIRLRGKPLAWDSQSRVKAPEIDWDTGGDKSYLRGGVSSTYYDQRGGGSTPFGNSDKPIFITAAAAEFDHRAETAAYSGNARGWQEKNYVRADKFFIKQKEGEFYADGRVESLLYDAPRKEKGKEGKAPVYVSADKMFYARQNSLLRYVSNVDIRQGSDRATAGLANILLNEKNELAQTTLENNVVITQPGRKAVGEWAQYTADNEIAVLRGNPARVEDAESGSTEAAELAINNRENRIRIEGQSKQNTSRRIRSVYKVKGI